MELITFDLFIVVVIGGVGEMAIAAYYTFESSMKFFMRVYGSPGTAFEGDLGFFWMFLFFK